MEMWNIFKLLPFHNLLFKHNSFTHQLKFITKARNYSPTWKNPNSVLILLGVAHFIILSEKSAQSRIIAIPSSWTSSSRVKASRIIIVVCITLFQLSLLGSIRPEKNQIEKEGL